MNTSVAVKTIVGPTIRLVGGTYFDFLDPDGSHYTIEDIAHGLAMTCRFAGQCPRFYSVAEHSVHVSNIVPPEFAFAGLMHDAAEAFLGDVSRPLKGLLPEYKAIENRVEWSIFDRFGVVGAWSLEVKEADNIMLATEQKRLLHNDDDWEVLRGVRIADVQIECLDPERARSAFLSRFLELRPWMATQS